MTKATMIRKGSMIRKEQGESEDLTQANHPANRIAPIRPVKKTSQAPVTLLEQFSPLQTASEEEVFSKSSLHPPHQPAKKKQATASAYTDPQIAKEISTLCSKILTLETFPELYEFIGNSIVQRNGSERIIVLMQCSSSEKFSSTTFGIADSIGVPAEELPPAFHFSFSRSLAVPFPKIAPLSLATFRRYTDNQSTLKLLKKLSIQIVLPLIWQKKLQGLVLIGPQMVGNRFKGEYSSLHQTFFQLIQTLACVCGSRIEEKERLSESIQVQDHKERVQDYVLRIVTKIQSPTRLDDLVFFFRDLLDDKFQVRSFSLIGYNSLENCYQLLDQNGLSKDSTRKPFSLPHTSPIVQAAIQQKEGILTSLPDYAEMKDFQENYSHDDLTRMSDCILLPFFHAHEQMIFLLVIHSVARTWTQEEVQALELFSRLATWPITRMLEQKEIFFSSHDSYTPFEKRLYYEYRKCMANDKAISMIDIRFPNLDNIEHSKKNYGGSTSDSLSIETKDLFFKTILEKFHKQLTAHQYCHRMGKSHFILVLPHCKKKDAKKISDNLKKDLPRQISPTSEKIRYSCTISSSSTTGRLTFSEFINILN